VAVQRPDYEGCSFINVLLEYDDLDHPIRHAAAEHLATIRGMVREFAEQAGGGLGELLLEREGVTG
jgi:hypothetical protein